MIRRTSAVAILVAFLGAGCSTVAPAVDTSASAEPTFDGLYPISNTRADAAWSTADLDLSGYTKIMLQGAGIEYRPVKTPSRSSSASEFPLSDAQKQQFQKVVREAFLEELQKSEKFTFVNRPGRDVLLVRGALLDVVSAVPPERGGRGGIYLSRIGEATLVLELRDSMSDAILARAVDRRAAENIGGRLQESNRATNTQEVRRLVRHWARLLRTRLEEFGSP